MATYTQANRHMSAKFANLGADDLLLQQFSGEDSVSKLFRYELELLATSTTTIAFDNVLGQGVTVTILMAGGAKRYFNGIVSRFGQGQQVPSAQGTATFTRYRAEVVPQLWLLTRNHQSRIFQKQDVPTILKTVLTGVTLDNQIQGTYKTRDYCVQYRETDFEFASRLMEEEGIFYYFTHSDGAHKMVLADTQASFADVSGPATLVYETIEGGTRTDDRVHRWEKSQVIRSGKYRLWDYCFAKPTTNFEAIKPTQDSVAVGTVTHKLKLGANSNLEIYDYPGLYAQRFDGVDAPAVGDITSDSTRTVGIRMEEETAASLLLEGASTCRQLSSGGKFTLSKHFNGNGDYVLTGVQHAASAGDAYTTGDEDSLPYTNTFQCIPAALTFRPARTTPRPTIEGTQTAVVVGNSGDEILTDKYSRIKVQFPWDRQGQNNADSSCWIRVATPWAGTQWGIIHIPRVGQEVVVAFEEGDPDRPIVVGSVYNFNEMPPYTLVDNMTQSGYLSRSTKSGTSDNFNQLRFEDKKGSEEVYFHAEKDYNTVVENNETRKVGADKKDKGDQTIEIYNNRSLTVGSGKSQADDGSETITVFNNQTLTVGDAQAKSGSQTITVYKDRTETVKTGNETITIEQGNRNVTIKTGNEVLDVKTGNRTVTVDTGNDTHEIKMGNRAVTIDLGNDTLTIKLGNQTTKLNVGSSTTDALQGITLKSGPSSVEITPMGVTIKGMMISVQGTVQTEVKGLMTSVKGDVMLQAQGAITMIG